MMKHVFGFVLVMMVLSFALVGCGGNASAGIDPTPAGTGFDGKEATAETVEGASSDGNAPSTAENAPSRGTIERMWSHQDTPLKITGLEVAGPDAFMIGGEYFSQSGNPSFWLGWEAKSGQHVADGIILSNQSLQAGSGLGFGGYRIGGLLPGAFYEVRLFVDSKAGEREYSPAWADITLPTKENLEAELKRELEQARNWANHLEVATVRAAANPHPKVWEFMTRSRAKLLVPLGNLGRRLSRLVVRNIVSVTLIDQVEQGTGAALEALDGAEAGYFSIARRAKEPWTGKDPVAFLDSFPPDLLEVAGPVGKAAKSIEQLIGEAAFASLLKEAENWASTLGETAAQIEAQEWSPFSLYRLDEAGNSARNASWVLHEVIRRLDISTVENAQWTALRQHESALLRAVGKVTGTERLLVGKLVGEVETWYAELVIVLREQKGTRSDLPIPTPSPRVGP